MADLRRSGTGYHDGLALEESSTACFNVRVFSGRISTMGVKSSKPCAAGQIVLLMS